MAAGIEASQQNRPVIMTPTQHCYLDYTQGDHSVENPIYADLSLQQAYNFNPIPEGANAAFILGGQGNLWTEAVPDLQFAFYMTYPRAFALSESLWSQNETKDWGNFIAKTQHHIERFDQHHINISKAVYDPIINVYKVGDKLMCELENHLPKTDVFFTIDNTYPVKYGQKYTQAFEIPQGNLNLRTQSFLNGKAIGRELIISRDELEKRIKN